MKNVRLGDYLIDYSGLCFSIKELKQGCEFAIIKKVDSKGKVTDDYSNFRQLSVCPSTVESLLGALSRNELSKDDIQTLEDLKEVIKKLTWLGNEIREKIGMGDNNGRG